MDRWIDATDGTGDIVLTTDDGVRARVYPYNEYQRHHGWEVSEEGTLLAYDTAPTIMSASREAERALRDLTARRQRRADKGIPRYVVTVWQATREYGGPEEGGWYYDAGRLVNYRNADTESEAYRLMAQLDDEYPATGKRNSVLGGEDYSVFMVDRDSLFDRELYLDEHDLVVAEYPKVTPHYE